MNTHTNEQIPIFKSTRDPHSTPSPLPAFSTTQEAPICASPRCFKPTRLKKRGTGHVKFCSSNCNRVGQYHKLDEEQRQALNKRSNQYRYQEKLLPRLRSISRATESHITPGTPVAVWTVRRFLLEGYADWRWGLALNFQQAREALAHLAGGYDQLERIEDALAITAGDLMKPTAKQNSKEAYA